MYFVRRLPWIEDMVSDEVLACAYRWLCQQRQHHSANQDVWWLRYHWPRVKAEMIEQLSTVGGYRFSPLKRYVIHGEAVDVWCAQDALVLKAMSIVLEKHLNPLLSSRCYHARGRGGMKGAVRDVQKELTAGQFFFRSDVLSYYASLDHEIIRAQFAAVIPDQTVLTLLDGFLNHLIDQDGLLLENKQGISRGCSLSPLIGALYLKPLDDAMALLPVRYARFMDDWVILAETRWKQRKAIRVMNEILATLKVSKHPDKTTVGRVEKGIDFLGYRLSLTGLTIGHQTWSRLGAKLSGLEEQPSSAARLQRYWRRFIQWTFSGLQDVLGWKSWLTSALAYFSKEKLLALLQRCSKLCSPPVSLLRSLFLV